MGTEEGSVSDDAGCFVILTMFVLVGIFVLIGMPHAGREGYARGYRRGFCEGRGGVEATVGDSIRCIRPPVAMDTARGR